MAQVSKRSRTRNGSLDRLVFRCAEALEVLYSGAASGGAGAALYTECVGYVTQMLAVLVAAERVPLNVASCEPIQRAYQAIFDAVEDSTDGPVQAYADATRDAASASGLGIFAPGEFAADPATFNRAAQIILQPHPEAPIEQLFFETVPLSWLGRAYQYMLAFRPASDGDGLHLDRSHRKGGGVFFTPPFLVTYIIESVLTPLVESRTGILDETSSRERIAALRVLDPAMGGGDFLSAAVDFLGFGRGDRLARAREAFAANCVYGVDVDPQAVEVARFCVWAASGYADGIADALNTHLICANALGIRHGDDPLFDWAEAFPEVFVGGDSAGFDAVVGNPPYVAAKNGLGRARGSTAGQSDFYLMFLSAAMDHNLVKPGGLFSMVLPDPMLVRENAAPVRRKLVTDWTVLSLLHISEAFEDALVANVVPVCRNASSTSPTFLASRIERVGDRRSFALRPREIALELGQPVRRDTVLAQDRCEFLYLLEQGSFGDVIRRIHGPDAALSHYEAPFTPLRKLNVKATYRGEEVGKSAIDQENGDLPILLGGQSIQPYEVAWEGRKANRSWVQKPIERYMSTKLLIQKSSARLVAALDHVGRKHKGYVFPQSVYGVELRRPGMSEYYLLCILNSRVMNEYIWRTVTGYKLLQPQLELEDIRALPIRRIDFTTHSAEREAEVARGIRLFEDESLRTGGSVPFSELANFTVRCLTGNPERSDVVHDVLAHLGRLMVDLSKAGRKAPDSEVTRKLESTRSAIEAIVWRLYSSEPAQMALPW